MQLLQQLLEYGSKMFRVGCETTKIQQRLSFVDSHRSELPFQPVSIRGEDTEGVQVIEWLCRWSQMPCAGRDRAQRFSSATLLPVSFFFFLLPCVGDAWTSWWGSLACWCSGLAENCGGKVFGREASVAVTHSTVFWWVVLLLCAAGRSILEELFVPAAVRWCNTINTRDSWPGPSLALLIL